jgi:hypothetical protein
MRARVSETERARARERERERERERSRTRKATLKFCAGWLKSLRGSKSETSEKKRDEKGSGGQWAVGGEGVVRGRERERERESHERSKKKKKKKKKK